MKPTLLRAQSYAPALIITVILVACDSTPALVSTPAPDVVERSSHALNTTLSIGDFALYAEHSVKLGDRASVLKGDVGVRAVAPSSYGSQLVVGARASVVRKSNLLAPSVSLGIGSSVGDVQTNSLQRGKGTVGNVASFPSGLPSLPTARPSTPGPKDVVLAAFGAQTITPGAYGSVHVGRTARLLLEPGTYSVANVTIDQGGLLLAKPGGVDLRVRDSFSASRYTGISPISINASDLVISVGGQGGATIGDHSAIQALLDAPGGTLSLGNSVVALGAFAGFDVVLGSEATAALEKGFTATTAYPQGTQPIAGQVAPAIRDGKIPVVGKLTDDTLVSLGISLPLVATDSLAQLIKDLGDPASPRYRQYLTAAQLADQFGRSQSEYDALVAYATAHNLRVVKTYDNRAYLTVQGTVADIQKAFYVTLNVYQRDDGTTFYAPANEPSADVPVPVLHISGLNNFAVPIPAGGSGPQGDCGGTSQTFVGDDFRNIYLPCLAQRTPYPGSGQAIAIMSPGNVELAAAGNYADHYMGGAKASLIPKPQFQCNTQPIQWDGSAGKHDKIVQDVLASVEMAMAMAPYANIYVYESGYDYMGTSSCNGTPETGGWSPVTLIHNILNEVGALKTNVVVNTYGWDIADTSELAALDGALQLLAGMGVSFFQASGDEGAYLDASDTNIPRMNSLPKLPLVASHYMTVVGGTQLTTTSPTSYGSESAWKTQTANIASGGGFCIGYTTPDLSVTVPTLPQPYYQQGVNPTNPQVNNTARMLPDVAMVADQLTIWVISHGIPSGPTNICFRGTSAAAALWAGMAALANQDQMMGSPGAIGFANPWLYRLATRNMASYTSNFRDVNDGSTNDLYGADHNYYNAFSNYDLVTGLGSPRCAALEDLPTESCMPGTSLSAIVDTNAGTVTAYVPNGSWDWGEDNKTGVSVFAVEGNTLPGGVTKTVINTPLAVNTCSGNSYTGDVVCTSNETDVYIINGAAITHTLTSSASATESFSGGYCKTCNVAVDPVLNRAYVSIGTSAGTAAFQALDLATYAMGTPVPVGQQATSEDIAIDSTSGLVLSPNEEGDYQIFKPSTGEVFNFWPASPAWPVLDGAAIDCTTRIALSSVEFSNMLFLADLKQATFLGTSWSAPYQVVSIPEFQPMVDNSAGTCGIAVAPNSHLGIVTGEYGGNQIGVIKLPDKSGNAAGTPTILDYAAAFLPNTPDGLAWQMGLDPHTVTAYTSPTNRKQYAIIEDDAYVGLDYSKHGTRTYLAVVDLQALLALPRADPTHNVRDPLVTCQGAGVNGTPPVPNCVVRFVGSNP